MSSALSASTTPRGKVLWHFTMSLDGFIAGPEHSMDWLSGLSIAPGVIDELIATTGAVLGGRRGYDADPDAKPYGGAWSGPIFILTHHPEDARPSPEISFLNCDVSDAVQEALAAAAGKNVELLGANVARQCAIRGLIDELYVHLAPVMLGDSVRVFECPGIQPLRWERVGEGAATRVIDVRYRPMR
jgi:dihydrofolate reductase